MLLRATVKSVEFREDTKIRVRLKIPGRQKCVVIPMEVNEDFQRMIESELKIAKPLSEDIMDIHLR